MTPSTMALAILSPLASTTLTLMPSGSTVTTLVASLGAMRIQEWTRWKADEGVDGESSASVKGRACQRGVLAWRQPHPAKLDEEVARGCNAIRM